MSNENNIKVTVTRLTSGTTWTNASTSLLLKLYETEFQSLVDTLKKKTKIWHTISEKMKTHHIDVTPDQVRWKINALTKKYQHCVESGSQGKFKYFTEMDHIYSKHDRSRGTCTISEYLYDKSDVSVGVSMKADNKAIIELKKIRLANRLESDRVQTKIQIERQWLDYLKRQEHSRRQKEEVVEKQMKIEKQELDIKRKDIELRHAIELKNIQLIEKDITEILQIQREKCDLLKLLS